MRICSQYVGLRKVYEMTEFQSFKISKFERVALNSFSGLVFYIITFFFVLIFVLVIPDVILAQETSEDDGLEDVLSGFDAVDDTVHFMHNFLRNQHIHQDVQVAVEKTLTSTGRAMLLTTIVLSAGFFIFIISSMNNLISFGLITGLTIIIALFGDILLAPAMMALIYKKRPSNSIKKETL